MSEFDLNLFHKWWIILTRSENIRAKVELEQLIQDIDILNELENEGNVDFFKDFLINTVLKHPFFTPLDPDDPLIKALWELIKIYDRASRNE